MTHECSVEDSIKLLQDIAVNVTPGDWWINSHGTELVSANGDGIVTVFEPKHYREKAHRDENTGNLSYWQNDTDASWIVNAQPRNVLRIIDTLQARIAELEKAAMPQAALAMLADNDAVEGCHSWVASEEQTINVGQVQGNFDEHIESSAGWVARFLGHFLKGVKS